MYYLYCGADDASRKEFVSAGLSVFEEPGLRAFLQDVRAMPGYEQTSAVFTIVPLVEEFKNLFDIAENQPSFSDVSNINKIIEEKTEFKDVINPDPDLRILALTLSKLDVGWKNDFEKVGLRSFTKASGIQQDIPFMEAEQQVGKVRMGKYNGWSWELQDGYCLTVFPCNTPKEILEWCAKNPSATVWEPNGAEERTVVMPMFKIITNIDCRDTMERMGILRLFNEFTANLFRVTPKFKKLFVNSVMSKTSTEFGLGGISARQVVYGGFRATCIKPKPKELAFNSTWVAFLSKGGTVVMTTVFDGIDG